MIELGLSIDETARPISGRLLGGADAGPIAFTGYVELVAALQRACESAAPAGPHPSAAREGASS